MIFARLPHQGVQADQVSQNIISFLSMPRATAPQRALQLKQILEVRPRFIRVSLSLSGAHGVGQYRIS